MVRWGWRLRSTFWPPTGASAPVNPNHWPRRPAVTQRSIWAVAYTSSNVKLGGDSGSVTDPISGGKPSWGVAPSFTWPTEPGWGPWSYMEIWTWGVWTGSP